MAFPHAANLAIESIEGKIYRKKWYRYLLCKIRISCCHIMVTHSKQKA
jgi:hypothetical protein